MGLRFDITLANWISFVVEDNVEIPSFESPVIRSGPSANSEAIKRFLYYIRENLMSSPTGEMTFRRVIDAISVRDKLEPGDLLQIRSYFLPRSWTALILPSGRPNSRLDHFLCSDSLLRILVDAGSTDRGLLLQLDEPPNAELFLTDVFPAFAKALRYRTEWPGLLIWDSLREVEFFPLGNDEHSALERLTWIFRNFKKGALKSLRKDFERSFGLSVNRPVTIIQISDVHLGSAEANLRLPLLQQYLSQLVNRYSSDSNVLIAVTGDLMDSPDHRHLDYVRTFIQYLRTLTQKPPILLLGNHDVRRDGYLDKRLNAALQLPLGGASFGVQWYEEYKLGVVVFNSVVSGHLATGHVGERQMIDLAIQLDQKLDRSDYTLVSAIHHHPTAVKRPSWYASPFYERILGPAFEETDSLEDAGSFLQFVREQEIAAILHGHKHIPRIDKVPQTDIPIIGCGSSVGKVSTRDGMPYISVNILTIDRMSQSIAARLLASRAAGGRLTEQGEHQAVLLTPLAKG